MKTFTRRNYWGSVLKKRDRACKFHPPLHEYYLSSHYNCRLKEVSSSVSLYSRVLFSKSICLNYLFSKNWLCFLLYTCSIFGSGFSRGPVLESGIYWIPRLGLGLVDRGSPLHPSLYQSFQIPLNKS